MKATRERTVSQAEGKQKRGKAPSYIGFSKEAESYDREHV